jgi:polyhydroxybutyrate depolymerase
MPVLTFHGTADITNPFAGNDDARWGYATETAVSRWARLNRCKRGPRTRSVTPTVSIWAFDRCAADATATLYRADGGGHDWPGSPTSGGTTDSAINATSLILNFFRTRSLTR